MAVTDLYDYVAERFIRNFQKGTASWISPWSDSAAGGLPIGANGKPFRSINVPILWDAAQKRDFSSSLWLTARQAGVLGGEVRKGAHPTIAATATKLEARVNRYDDESHKVVYARPFWIFNLAQIRGLERLAPIGQPDAGYSAAAIGARAAGFIAAADEALNTKQGTAVERPADANALPQAQENLSVRARRVVERAAERSALAPAFERAVSGPLRDIRQELAIRLATEFLCADLNIPWQTSSDARFSSQDWVTLLQENKRAVFDASSYAQKSLDYLRTLARR